METTTATPAFDGPEEITEDSFTSDLRRPTEQDNQEPPPRDTSTTGPQPPPADQPKPPPPPPKEKPVDILSDSEFQGEISVDFVNVVVSMGCQMYCGEANPELFKANKENVDQLKEITGKVLDRYKIQMDPWIGLLGVATITYAPLIKRAVDIRKVKTDASGTTKTTTTTTFNTEVKRGPGRPPKQEQEMRDLEARLAKLKNGK